MARFAMFIKTAAVAFLLAGAPVFAGDWPGYRGPTDDAAVADAKMPDKLALTPVWSEPLGDSFGQFSVVGGKAFAFVERGEDEMAICLDAATGKELWAVKIDATIHDSQGGDGPRSTPAVSGERVYVYGTHLQLACLDIADGHVVWQHNIAKEFGDSELHWGSAVSPLVVDDVVIVTGGNAGKGIYAFNKETGKLAWNKTSEKGTQATGTVATILGTKQVICFTQGGLVSVDPKNGDVLWTFAHRYSTATAASPVVGGKNGDVVYCSCAYGVGAAACRVSKEGEKWKAVMLWETKGQNMNHWATPVQRDGYIYGLYGNGTGPGVLSCLDIETGEVKWSQKGISNQGGALLLGDKIVIQTPQGELILIAASPEGYKELGRQSVLKTGKSWTAPVYAEGMFFVRSTSGGGGKRGGPTTPGEAACLKVAGE